jgi:hypothetical protein
MKGCRGIGLTRLCLTLGLILEGEGASVEGSCVCVCVCEIFQDLKLKNRKVFSQDAGLQNRHTCHDLNEVKNGFVVALN